MLIVYESKTGFTKKYAHMLAEKTGLRALRASELSKEDKAEQIIYLGWIKVGRIQGLKKAAAYDIKAVCACGTGRAAEPDEQTVISRNNIQGIPFFYLRGGCYPLKKIRGIDRMLLSVFVSMLKKRKDKDESAQEAIAIIENGFDAVNEKNLLPVIEWLDKNR